MILTDDEITQVRARVNMAFPRFTRWEHVNKADEHHTGFSIWGVYACKSSRGPATQFFVTFSTFKATWSGHLTVGKPSYFWSSTDVGDASLLGTAALPTLDEAIGALMRQLRELFAVLLGEDASAEAT